jgi:hypothetical protein
MRIRTILVIVGLYAVPVCAQQAVKTECRSLNGSNQFVGPDEVIVPAGDGYQVCRSVQVKAPVEVAPKTQAPAQVETAPVVRAPEAQAPAQEGNIQVRDFADINN